MAKKAKKKARGTSKTKARKPAKKKKVAMKAKSKAASRKPAKRKAAAPKRTAAPARKVEKPIVVETSEEFTTRTTTVPAMAAGFLGGAYGLGSASKESFAAEEE